MTRATWCWLIAATNIVAVAFVGGGAWGFLSACVAAVYAALAVAHKASERPPWEAEALRQELADARAAEAAARTERDRARTELQQMRAARAEHYVRIPRASDLN